LAARWAIALAGAAAFGFLPGYAAAQVDILSRETAHGVVDLRASAADGEQSFTKDGFGKARYGGSTDAGWAGRFQVAQAALEWTPRLNWEWSAVIDAGYQPGQEHPFDLYQAYILFKPVPHSATRFAAKLGYFYPPISLEHDARVWGLTDAITPSAINSWIGEEVKVVGAEAKVSRDFGDQTLEVNAALFAYDDTAGTLLAFRGWALHDLQSQAQGSFPLPPRSHLLTMLQGDDTYSTLRIDHRLGYYAKVAWSLPAPVRLEALYYDNNGDRLSTVPDWQWAWKTRFTSLAATVRIDPKTRLMAQALNGHTEMGFPVRPLSSVAFRSAFALVRRDVGKDALTFRADFFETKDDARRLPVSSGEHGWALMGAWRHPFNDSLDLRLEALHINSTRPSRLLAGEAPHQAQNVLQSSLRFSF
jgi:hypothetical protein